LQRIGSRLGGFISFLIARATACLDRGISLRIVRNDAPAAINSAIRSRSSSVNDSTTHTTSGLIQLDQGL
jgi:hypothetical protein